MIDFLQNIDDSILLAINGCHAPWADWLMFRWTKTAIWIPLYVVLATLAVRQMGWRKGIFLVMLAGVMIGVNDQLATQLIKPGVARMRPANVDNPINTLLHLVNNYRCGKAWGSFPSSHASNTIALALLLGRALRGRIILTLLIVWSLINCYSRLYLGVHYPSDILGGLTIGIIISCGFTYLFRRYGSRVDALWRKTPAVVTADISLHVQQTSVQTTTRETTHKYDKKDTQLEAATLEKAAK